MAPLGGAALTLTLMLGMEAVAVAAAAAVHKGAALPGAKVEIPQQDVVAAGALRHGLQAAFRRPICSKEMRSVCPFSTPDYD